MPEKPQEKERSEKKNEPQANQITIRTQPHNLEGLCEFGPQAEIFKHRTTSQDLTNIIDFVNISYIRQVELKAKEIILKGRSYGESEWIDYEKLKPKRQVTLKRIK
jgi:hypothetical protein